MSSCCGTSENTGKKKPDYILWSSSIIIALSLILHIFIDLSYLQEFTHTVIELLSTMWWGVVLGTITVGFMSKVPREYFQKILGRGDTFGGVIRAGIAGLLLDMCSHGILMVGAKLYERGASTAQVMTFLIASPWNSLSLTIILISLIGLKWTLLFIAGSALIAIISGLIFQGLERTGTLKTNPNSNDIDKNFHLISDARQRFKGWKPSLKFFKDIATGGLHEAQMLLRWLLLGVVIAAAMNAFIPPDWFSYLFGPTMIGILITLAIATVLEVCSEGSAPIASEILNNAAAPGNAFAFLMAGVATDYTEILVLKDTTGSWKTALFLPLVTVPQVILLGYIMNLFS